jgi:putative transposase
MANYLRNYVAGGTYFFTVVTHKRRQLFSDDCARNKWQAALQRQRVKTVFEQMCYVILPDHIHTIWTLPPGDSNYSLRWQQMKENFTRNYLAGGGFEDTRTLQQHSRRERTVWQPRFWEHTVRDESDFKRCVDYIHWNPVKHELVTAPKDYPWSSFHEFVRLGEYPIDWGCGTGVDEVLGAEWD